MINVNFIGIGSRKVTEQYVVLCRSECLAMVRDKKCKDTHMNCKNETCYLNESSTEYYRWLQTLVFKVWWCSLKPILVIAKFRNSTLFEKCYIDDLYCLLNKSVIVWS